MKQKITNFHDGDLLCCSWGNEKKGCRWLSILKGEIDQYEDCSTFYESYVDLVLHDDGQDIHQLYYDSYADSQTEIRWATKTEKRLLFEALEADECYKADDILNRFFKNDRTSCTSN